MTKFSEDIQRPEMRHMTGQGSFFDFFKFIIQTWQSESHFTGELNNQSHSHANATTFYALLFCFSQHKRLAFKFNMCNVLPVLQYSILNDVPLLGKKKMSAGSRMQGSCFFSSSKSSYFLLKKTFNLATVWQWCPMATPAVCHSKQVPVTWSCNSVAQDFWLSLQHW